jgi:hypothetical protein
MTSHSAIAPNSVSKKRTANQKRLGRSADDKSVSPHENNQHSEPDDQELPDVYMGRAEGRWNVNTDEKEAHDPKQIQHQQERLPEGQSKQFLFPARRICQHAGKKDKVRPGPVAAVPNDYGKCTVRSCERSRPRTDGEAKRVK